MSERIKIGSVCEKGNHSAFYGDSDYGACGDHYYADIYVVVERKVHEDGTPHYGRGQDPDLEKIAKEIRDAMSDSEEYRWSR